MSSKQVKQALLGGMVMISAPILFYHDPVKILTIVFLWLGIITMGLFLMKWI